MSISKKLTEMLDEKNVDYEVLHHPVTYTAQETAASVHRPGREVVKSVILTDGADYVMAVVDAPHQVDLDKFSRLSGMKNPSLTGENKIRELFPDCEPGAMPPFGNLYDIQVYVDSHLEADDTITFNAGSHFEAIRMKFLDFKDICEPRFGDIVC